LSCWHFLLVISGRNTNVRGADFRFFRNTELRQIWGPPRHEARVRNPKADQDRRPTVDWQAPPDRNSTMGRVVEAPPRFSDMTGAAVIYLFATPDERQGPGHAWPPKLLEGLAALSRKNRQTSGLACLAIGYQDELLRPTDSGLTFSTLSHTKRSRNARQGMADLDSVVELNSRISTTLQ